MSGGMIISYKEKLNTTISQRKALALFPMVILLGSSLLFNPIPLMADPPPEPPPGTILPKVFCFKITDIREVKGDPEGNKFTFEFEVLNWSNDAAGDVHLSLAMPDTSGVRFTSAGVDSNGRPLVPVDTDGNGMINAADNEDDNGNGLLNPGEDNNGNGRLDNDPMPGNLPTLNNWIVVEQTSTNVLWTVPDPFNADLDDIAFLDLIGGAGGEGGTLGANELIPGFPPDPPGTTTIDALGNVSPLEAIDNGNNVLDGFTFTVDNLDGGDVFQLNWFLSSSGFGPSEDPFGSPIGTSFGGNNYGFGVIIISRANIAGGFGGPVYIGNAGVQQTQLEFFDSVYIVPDPAVMAAEFGAGLTAEFVDPNDNTLGAGINAVPLVTNTPFASLSAEVEAEIGDDDNDDDDNSDELESEGTFMLGGTSNGINPVTDQVTINIGGIEKIIPAGSFIFKEHPTKPQKNVFKFKGIIDGMEVEMKIKPLQNNKFKFEVEIELVQLSLCGSSIVTGGTVPVSLTVGDDTGSTNAKKKIEGLGNCP